MEAATPWVQGKSLELQRLNRMPWAAGATFTIFGLRIGLRVNAREFLDPLINRLPAGWEPGQSMQVQRLYSVIGGNHRAVPDGQRNGNFLFANGQALGNAMSWDELYEALQSDLDFYVGRTTRARLFVHAGAVAWKGQAIIIPGESHSGKTTLVQALLEAGATYYSDEFSVLDSDGRVHPFPRALSVRIKEGVKKIAPHQFGAPTGDKSVSVGLVILTHYEGSAHWCPRIMSPGHGMLGLIKNTLAARRYPELAMRTLGKAISSAGVVESARGDAKEVTDWIAQHLDW